MAKRKYAWIKQVKNWVNLYNRTQKNLVEDIIPKPKGRPRKDSKPTDPDCRIMLRGPQLQGGYPHDNKGNIHPPSE
jgi:hypothetical protein